MTLILAFLIVLPGISLAYHIKHPPTPSQCYRAQQRRKRLAQITGISFITACVKLIKEKE